MEAQRPDRRLAPRPLPLHLMSAIGLWLSSRGALTSLATGLPGAFVALEDWINDGVPLGIGVARDCAYSWYGENDPGRGRWRVDGRKVDPKRLQRPSLLVLPSRDSIVPPKSAEPLADALGASTVLRPPLGHIGMMSAASAPAMLWNPIADWLRAHLGNR